MEPSDRAAVLFAPYFFAQGFDGFADLWDGFLLGDQEGDHHFPEILTENPDAGTGVCRRREVDIVCADGGDERAVIGAEIEVLFPERKRFVRAVEEETVRRPGNFQIVRPADE